MSLESRFVTQLTPKDFSKTVPYKLVKHKCSIVLFYTDWCPHCSDTKPVWNELGEKAAFFDVCAFNCEKYDDHFNKIQQANPTFVAGYPTIWIYQGGTPIKEYDGPRDVGSLIKQCMNSCKLGN